MFHSTHTNKRHLRYLNFSTWGSNIPNPESQPPFSENQIGPRMEPCETPLVSSGKDVDPPCNNFWKTGFVFHHDGDPKHTAGGVKDTQLNTIIHALP